jgi:hypothetical protein
MCAQRSERLRCRAPDSGCRARNPNHLAAKRLFGDIAELCLFERPVLDLEKIARRQGFISPEARSLVDDADRRLVNIERDIRGFGILGRGEETGPRNKNNSWERIEWFFLNSFYAT